MPGCSIWLSPCHAYVLQKKEGKSGAAFSGFSSVYERRKRKHMKKAPISAMQGREKRLIQKRLLDCAGFLVNLDVLIDILSGNERAVDIGINLLRFTGQDVMGNTDVLGCKVICILQ